MHLLAIWHLALTGGMLIALLVLRTGTRGVLLFLCCLLPQWLLYAAMWSREVQAMLRRGRRQKDSSNTENQIREIWLELSDLAGMCLLCIAGAAVESFLARWILQLWMRLF
jgi:hypothetical protein